MRSTLLVMCTFAAACSVPTTQPKRFVEPPPAPPEQPTATPASTTPQRRVATRGIPNTYGIFQMNLGGRNLEDSRWGSLDNQFSLGLDYTWKHPDAPVGLNFGWTGAGDRARVLGTDVYAWQGELVLGPRFYLDIPNSPVYFYGGVAAALVYSELSVPFGIRESDTQFGIMASAGASFRINARQSVGVEWRTLQGTDFGTRLPASPNDSNYQQLSLMFSVAL